MGMFDSVVGKCPYCGTENELQSKAGECMLRSYNLDTADKVPIQIARDLHGSTETCYSCGKPFTLIFNNPDSVYCCFIRADE